MGRVVITHSTYLKGLIPHLKKLVLESGIKTITPGKISRVKGRSDTLQLRITTSIRGGYKLIARKGSSAQEIFIVTTLSEEELRKIMLNKLRLL